jgi:uncharacterized membrane protein
MPEGADPISGPATNRMAISLLATIGFFVALYLWAHNLGLTGPMVCGIGDCGTVQASEYATIGPVSVSAIGVVGYLILIALSMLGLQPAYRGSKLIGGLMLAGSGGGVLFSGYLTYLEAAVINAWCQYCVISAILITLIFLACLPELAHLKGEARG